MTKQGFVGVNGVAKGIKNLWVGDDNGVARKVKRAWVGDENGVARQWFGSTLLSPELSLDFYTYTLNTNEYSGISDRIGDFWLGDNLVRYWPSSSNSVQIFIFSYESDSDNFYLYGPYVIKCEGDYIDTIPINSTTIGIVSTTHITLVNFLYPSYTINSVAITSNDGYNYLPRNTLYSSWNSNYIIRGFRNGKSENSSYVYTYLHIYDKNTFISGSLETLSTTQYTFSILPQDGATAYHASIYAGIRSNGYILDTFLETEIKSGYYTISNSSSYNVGGKYIRLNKFNPSSSNYYDRINAISETDDHYLPYSGMSNYDLVYGTHSTVKVYNPYTDTDVSSYKIQLTSYYTKSDTKYAFVKDDYLYIIGAFKANSSLGEESSATYIPRIFYRSINDSNWAFMDNSYIAEAKKSINLRSFNNYSKIISLISWETIRIFSLDTDNKSFTPYTKPLIVISD